MEIKLPNDTVTTSGPDVEFILGDKGSAFVSLNLIIGQGGNILHKLNHDQTYSGNLTQSLPLTPGNYRCAILISAFSHGALGTTYDSFLKIAKKNVATAKGSIPDGTDTDFNSVSFQLIVS